MNATIGIIGAGNRGHEHTQNYRDVEEAHVKAVADIDEPAANRLAREHDVPDVYKDFRELLDDDEIEAVSICVHNNLHTPIAVEALEAGKHVFCEKPLAGSYTDAKRIIEVASETGKRVGVQNMKLFTAATRAAKAFLEEGQLGDVSFARSVYSRRRGRPYVDGYGTPSFVQKERAGGGPVFDIGTYEIGRMLYLLGNPEVERINGHTFEYHGGSYAPELTGENTDLYEERLNDSGYDVEDAGAGAARLSGDRRLEVRAAWHMFSPDERGMIVGNEGGLAFDPLEYLTTTSDYETTAEIDVEEYERRQSLIRSDSGYDANDRPTQFDHWIETIRGTVDPIPTGTIALNSTLIMEGIYLSDRLGREVSADEVKERSQSRCHEL